MNETSSTTAVPGDRGSGVRETPPPAERFSNALPLPRHVSALTDEALEEELALLAGVNTSAVHRGLTLLREFDARGGWARQGFLTAAHWLSHVTSLERSSAREKVRVARALGELPLIDEALRTVQLSYSKVRALTRVATPENRELLLVVALRGTTAHVEEFVRRYRSGTRVSADARGRSQLESRELHVEWDSDGMLSLRGRLAPDDGARLLAALEAIHFPSRARLREAGQRGAPPDERTFPQRRADALMELVDAGVYAGMTGQSPEAERSGVGAQQRLGGSEPGPVQPGEHAGAQSGTGDVSADASSVEGAADVDLGADTDDARSVPEAPRTGGPPGSTGLREPMRITLHVNIDALCEDGEDPSAFFADGPRVAPELARRLSCDANIAALVESASGEPLALGRTHRTVPPALRRALVTRDEGCRFPGCTRRRYLEAHHIEHWATGGETRLDNLVLLCPHHHRFTHEHGYAIERCSASGELVFRPPEGPALRESSPPLPPPPRDVLRVLRDWCAQQHVEVDATSLRSPWDGMRWYMNDYVDDVIRHDAWVEARKRAVERGEEPPPKPFFNLGATDVYGATEH